MQLAKMERLLLKTHSALNERWVQDRIAEDPTILGLGELVLKDKERMQPRAGRLDLLLQDIESDRRYEVEIQLGRTDESHIIRTLEYWDIERRRYPQYDHCAVIVAEDITSRFLNVISLFNSAVPIVAIQLAAYQINGQVGLVFTTVLNELSRGIDEDDVETTDPPVDEGYWEKKVGRDILGMAKQVLGDARQLDPRLELKFNKSRIRIYKDGIRQDFAQFRPTRSTLRLEVELPKSESTDQELEEAGIEVMPHKWGRYRIRLTKSDLESHGVLVRELLRRAWEGRDQN